MGNKHKAVYRNLLRLYPKPFRERFGESMEQTFDDLCSERGAPTASLMIRLSVDTGIGIVKEHILSLAERRSMNVNIFSNPKFTGPVGFLLALPGSLMLTGMMFGIEPPLGPFAADTQNGSGPHIFGSLVVLTAIIVLPAAGLILNAGPIRRAIIENKNLAISASAGLLAVAPLMVLERINQPNSAFPFALFAIMWLLAALFVAILMPLARKIRRENGVSSHPTTLLLGAFVLVIFAAMWGGLLVDQMPCFLGVPNCD